MAAACCASIPNADRDGEVRTNRTSPWRLDEGRREAKEGNQGEDETQAVKTNKLPLQTSRA